MIRDLLPRLSSGERLTREEAALAVRSIVRGETEPALIAAFLMALAQRGESAEELAGGAEGLRSEAVPFPPAPWTTSARSTPSDASTRAMVESRVGSGIPRSWSLAPAGFASGPSQLNRVRIPSAWRRAATRRMEGW